MRLVPAAVFETTVYLYGFDNLEVAGTLLVAEDPKSVRGKKVVAVAAAMEQSNVTAAVAVAAAVAPDMLMVPVHCCSHVSHCSANGCLYCGRKVLLDQYLPGPGSVGDFLLVAE